MIKWIVWISIPYGIINFLIALGSDTLHNNPREVEISFYAGLISMGIAAVVAFVIFALIAALKWLFIWRREGRPKDSNPNRLT
jgi:hypothetical protein